MPHALVIDDDPVTVISLTETIEEEGFAVSTAKNLSEARERLGDVVPDLIVLDVVLPDGNGLEFLRELEDRSAVEVILITAHQKDVDSVEALQLGASAYIAKPVDRRRLKVVLAEVSRTKELKEEVAALEAELRELGRFGSMLGNSAVMQDLYEQIQKVAPTDATALVIGESGTGKELVAQAVHRYSRRRRAAFLPVNCGAMSPNLIESELFGHEKGSFTGANRMHHGCFERANGGTLFLDEITEMPLDLQVKLLRTLETGKIVRVGGDTEVEVDVRVVAATNRDPDEAVKEECLREDLLFRLGVFPIRVPPLRERGDDLEFLAAHFLADLNRAQGTSKRFAPDALGVLRSQDWPGNVRELKNVIHRAYILAEDSITTDCLPFDDDDDSEAQESDTAAPAGSQTVRVRVGTSLAAVEKRLIFATLDASDGDKREAAGKLGISVRTLYNRLKKYGVTGS